MSTPLATYRNKMKINKVNNSEPILTLPIYRFCLLKIHSGTNKDDTFVNLWRYYVSI